jgi:hypothetical protein
VREAREAARLLLLLLVVVVVVAVQAWRSLFMRRRAVTFLMTLGAGCARGPRGEGEVEVVGGGAGGGGEEDCGMVEREGRRARGSRVRW